MRTARTQGRVRRANIKAPTRVLAVKVFGGGWQPATSGGGVAIEIRRVRPRTLNHEPFKGLLEMLDSSASSRPVYTMRLQPDKHVIDPIKALRWALKRLLRDHGMKALSVEEERQP
jgi:hypothetical protein